MRFYLPRPSFWLSARAIAEPDIWWHLRNAAYILQAHSFPGVDTYSFGAAGSAWLDHEWRSEISFYLALKTMGLRGMLALYFALLLLTFCGVYYRACRAGAECKDATLATLLAIFCAIVSIGPRPLLFGWLCLIGLLLVLDRFQRSGKGIWVLPPLFVLWINLHGSWLFGQIVLIIVIASGLLGGEWGSVVARRWTQSELKKLLVALSASIVGLFVNPLRLQAGFLSFRSSSAPERRDAGGPGVALGGFQ